MKKLVIIPGGFHPFHGGHMSLYNAAKEAFPSADVFVAATADTSTRPFPFELKKMLARAAGVPAERFIQVKSPFKAEEITQMYNPKNTQLIFVRSQKDMQSQPIPGGVKKDGSPSYLQPYKRNGRDSFDKHAYIAYLPTVQFGPGMTSATEIRGKWPEMDNKQKIALVKALYPDTANNLNAAAKIVEIFDKVIGTKVDEIAPVIGAMVGGALARAAGAEALGQLAGRAVGSAVASHIGNDSVDETTQGAQASLIGSPAGVGAGGLQPANVEMPNGPDRERKGVRMGVEFDEATLVNDPDAGHQIRPAGGMGTWDEQSMVSNLARKFAAMVDMVKNKNYSGLHHVLYKAGVVENLVRALAEYEAFQKKQGRRPIARGREIEMSDYLDEKNEA